MKGRKVREESEAVKQNRRVSGLESRLCGGGQSLCKPEKLSSNHSSLMKTVVLGQRGGCRVLAATWVGSQPSAEGLSFTTTGHSSFRGSDALF